MNMVLHVKMVIRGELRYSDICFKWKPAHVFTSTDYYLLKNGGDEENLRDLYAKSMKEMILDPRDELISRDNYSK